MNKFQDVTSGQDGDVGRHAVPPRTTKRRTTTSLKTEKQPELPENRTVWKLTTNELKKKHSSRPIGRAQMGSTGERTFSKAAAEGPSNPTFAYR